MQLRSFGKAKWMARKWTWALVRGGGCQLGTKRGAVNEKVRIYNHL